MTTTLDVLVDIDGVLYPFPEVFTPYASDQLGRHLELDTTRWEFYEVWGLDYAGFVELVTQGVGERRLWWEGAPYPDVPGALDRIQAGGHRIHLVTARDISGTEAALAATNHWLAAHGFVVESVNLAQDKPLVLAELGLDPAGCVAVDDGPHHVQAWEDAGVVAMVLDRWGTYRGDHRAVRDLDGFAEFVERIADGSWSA
jgi:FMN phosphatase YigB (HAD superfamily)